MDVGHAEALVHEAPVGHVGRAVARFVEGQSVLDEHLGVGSQDRRQRVHERPVPVEDDGIHRRDRTSAGRAGPKPLQALGRVRADARLAAVPAILDHAAVRRVVDAAAKKGVAIDVTAFDESTHTAAQAARAVRAELGQIVKSLVFVIPRHDDDLEPVLCLVSGPNRVDLGRLAANAREANDLSGFVIGGIPPFGHERRMRVIMDPDLGRFETVWAAAGLPNVVFPVSPSTLRMLADAEVAPIAEDPPVERAS